MTFGERLRQLREKANLTQEALAQKAGMSIGSVRNYEQGIREPYWRGVFHLVKALGVSSEAFAECALEPEPVKPSKRKAGRK